MIDPTDRATVQLPCPLRLRFASPGRIYAVVLEQDLLGDWCVIQSWGGKRNQRGGGQVRTVESFETGLAIVDIIRKHREQRGYTVII